MTIIRLLLRCYGIDFSLIKRYCPFCLHTYCKSESSKIFNFLVSNERYDKNKTFYSSAMALILPRLKNSSLCFFMVTYKEAQILTSMSLSMTCLSVCQFLHCLDIQYFRLPFKANAKGDHVNPSLEHCTFIMLFSNGNI